MRFVTESLLLTVAYVLGWLLDTLCSQLGIWLGNPRFFRITSVVLVATFLLSLLVTRSWT